MDRKSSTSRRSRLSDRAGLHASVVPDQYGRPLAGSVEFFLDGNSIGSTAIDAGGEATLTTAPITRGPGSYAVTAKFTSSNDNYTDSSAGLATLVISPEDARPTYTGALFASTASPTSSLATVTLSATVRDITAVTDDPAFDPDAGDIRKATVRFVDRDHANAVLCTAPIGLAGTDPKTGTATCNWSANVGPQDSVLYTVGIVVGGFYAADTSADDAVVTVAKPLTTNFITGGGSLINQTSAGLVPGAAGQKTNFGFNVKYNKAGTNLQGQVNLIVRDGGRTYQIKSNSITSLAANSPTGTATFNGKASIQDITDPLNPVSVDGNASLQLTLTDKGEPGTSDTIGITLWNKSGGLWFASAWDGTKTVEQVLSGGNLVVR
jgi:hypothetical protein